MRGPSVYSCIEPAQAHKLPWERGVTLVQLLPSTVRKPQEDSAMTSQPLAPGKCTPRGPGQWPTACATQAPDHSQVGGLLPSSHLWTPIQWIRGPWIQWIKEWKPLELPSHSSGYDSTPPLQGAWVWSLAGGTKTVQLNFPWLDQGVCFCLCYPWHLIQTSEPNIEHYWMIISGIGLPWWFSGEESALQYRRPAFDPWSREIPHATG